MNDPDNPPTGHQQTAANAHFHSTAPAWRDVYFRSDLYSRLYQERRNAVLSLVDGLGLNSARVLEVGCGPGITTVALGDRGHTIYAIDTVPAMIDMTRKHAKDTHMEGQVLASIGDIHFLGFPENSFDLAVVVGVTEWLDSLDDPLRELARVVKPGGFLVITGDNTWSLNFVLDPLRNPVLGPFKRWARAVMQQLGRGPRAHCLLRSVSQLDRAIRGAGLQILRRATIGFGPFTLAGKNLLGDATGWKLHQRMQILADGGWPVLRSTGHIYIALVKKPNELTA